MIAATGTLIRNKGAVSAQQNGTGDYQVIFNQDVTGCSYQGTIGGPTTSRIGGSDVQWEPGMSRYSGYREYAQGAGWKVWVGLPGNPEVRQAPLKPSLPIPAYVPAEQIDVGDVL